MSAILPRGFNVGGSVQVRSTDYEGNWSRYTLGPPREDLTRTLSVSVFKRDFTLYGFAPQLVVTHEERTSNVKLYDYERTRGELRFVHQFRGRRQAGRRDHGLEGRGPAGSAAGGRCAAVRRCRRRTASRLSTSMISSPTASA